MAKRKPVRRPPDLALRETFRLRLIERTEQLGKNPERLAYEVNLSVASMYSYRSETSTTIPALDVADAIARALGVSLDWLTGRREFQNP